MKAIKAMPLILCLSLCASMVFAEESAPCGGLANDCLPVIAQFLKRLGNYLGFPLQDPWDETAQAKTQLLDAAATQNNEQNLVQTQVGALLISTQTPSKGNAILYKIIPGDPSAFLNSKLDATYAYTTASTSSTAAGGSSTFSLTRSPQIDQMPYQMDPVSQTLLNLLLTPPSASSCPEKIKAPSGLFGMTQEKPCVSLDMILQKAIDIPESSDYFNAEMNDVTGVLPLLNGDTLLSPLLLNSNPNSPAEISVTQADTFIRYVSGTLVPPALPEQDLIKKVIISKKSVVLKQYIADLRTYLAQVSIGLSNFYYSLSKRLPQPDATGNSSSQALNEYKMATWRLYKSINENPGAPPTPNAEWIAKINQANTTTLQKETVMLLAEINYQLYLSRQQQERLLLTNSALLLGSLKATRPDTNGLVAAVTNRTSPTDQSAPPTLP